MSKSEKEIDDLLNEKDVVVPMDEPTDSEADIVENDIEELAAINESMDDEVDTEAAPKKVSVSKYRKIPTKKSWDDLGSKFKRGDVVASKNGTKYEIQGPAVERETYIAREERGNIDMVVSSEFLSIVDEGFKTYNVWADRFNIPGFKVSCPSNTRYRSQDDV